MNKTASFPYPHACAAGFATLRMRLLSLSLLSDLSLFVSVPLCFLVRTIRFGCHELPEERAYSAGNSSRNRAIAQTAAIHRSLSFASNLIKLNVHNSVYISCRYRRGTGHFGREYPTLGSDSDWGHSATKTRGLPELRF